MDYRRTIGHCRTFFLALFIGLGISSCSKEEKEVVINLNVSPTAISMMGQMNSTAVLTISTEGSWSITGCPDEWLHLSATQGYGNTSVTLTAKTENWSDTERKATLTISADDKTVSATITQLGTLPKGLNVKTKNMTVMWDGFACDLEFTSKAIGYKEAFLTESSMQTMTDRDIFDYLMTKTEYRRSVDYTFLPGWVDPETDLIYCVSAYGNENNADGSHKYGPVTIVRIKTKKITHEADMSLTSSYTSSRWQVTASRQGTYGQRCDDYYYIAAEDDLAEEYYEYASGYTYALLTHLVFKPMIAANKNNNYLHDPQTMTFDRYGDIFFCATWGMDRDTKEYSSELSWVYRDLSGSNIQQRNRSQKTQDWDVPRKELSKMELDRLRSGFKLLRKE